MVNKHLNPGEKIVFTTRTHVKAVVVPSLILIVIAGVGGFLLSKVPDITDEHRGIGYGVVLAIMAVLALIFFVWPFLTWLTATYTVTNRRLTTHQGVITRTGHDIQLARISDVSYEKGLLDRILGCGTLVISDASDLGVKLPDVPKVEERQRIIADLLFQGANDNDGT
ncbi:PH domain-containing protein [Nocardioides marmoriginsengisoli]|uniref:PH domain-containing protein n=1 Tax=Nocardioides marmoriginsengisoli TaxID=661483 RepID=A0A3N0CI63_9ACTN|nr:PH domain-containing protein [Nocardioides marmoriginsengisoli]RNL63019.1 PH domain-containing protein [Nocardioides marmoriginsengisoli]